MAGRDLHVAEVYSGVQHRGDEGVPEHVRVHARQPDARIRSEVSQSAGGAVAVHPGPA
jgi:hypothetical protein